MSNIILDGVVLSNKDIYFKKNEKGFKFFYMDYDSESSKKQTIIPEKKIIFGKTIENRLIAIYCEVEKIEFYNRLSLNTDLFIEFRENKTMPKTFNKIVFCGGSLGSLVSIKEKEESNVLNPNYQPYQIVVPLEFNDLDKLVIISNISVHKNFNGISKRKSVSFELYLKNDKEIAECVEYIFIIQKMCQFLTFRKNIFFENIYLENKENNSKFANVYYDFGNIEDMDKKAEFSCIQVEDIKEKLPNLLKLIYNQDTNKNRKYCIEYFPANEDDLYLITNDKIKKICTSLECEINNNKKIKITDYKELDSLIKKIKKMVKDHREKENTLDSKTYSMISGSLSHIKGPLSQKIIAATKIYNELFMLATDETKIDINEEDINRFVKHRNDITHDGFYAINEDIANTAFFMMCFSYFLTLIRIGFNEEEIIHLIDKNRVIS